MLPRADDKSLYLTKAPDGWTSIGAYHNQEIYNRAGEKIGVVKDLLVGPDGKINAAVIGVGRFLGIGEKDVAVPLALRCRSSGVDNSGRLIMDVAEGHPAHRARIRGRHQRPVGGLSRSRKA